MKHIISVVIAKRLVKNKETKKDEIKDITYTNSGDVRFQRFIGLSMHFQQDLPITATLILGNPSPHFAKNIINQKFSISIGYNGSNLEKVFSGICTQAPYFIDENNGTDVKMHIPLCVDGGLNQTISMGNNQFVGSYSQIEVGSASETIGNVIDTLQSHFALKVDYVGDKNTKENIRGINCKTTLIIGNSNEDLSFVIAWFKIHNIRLEIMPSGKWLFSLYSYNGNTPQAKAISIKNAYSTTYPLVNTLIRSKYSAVDLSNSFGIELACVIPSLINCSFVVIKNVGQNINIFQSMNEKGTNGSYRILMQEVYFDTLGGGQHSLQLLLNEKSEFKKDGNNENDTNQ